MKSIPLFIVLPLTISFFLIGLIVGILYSSHANNSLQGNPFEFPIAIDSSVVSQNLLYSVKGKVKSVNKKNLTIFIQTDSGTILGPYKLAQNPTILKASKVGAKRGRRSPFGHTMPEQFPQGPTMVSDTGSHRANLLLTSKPTLLPFSHTYCLTT